MQLPQLTLNDDSSINEVGIEVFNWNLIENGLTQSIYSDPVRPLDEPSTLKIAHETTKGGTGRNSVVILKEIVADDDQVSYGGVTVSFKVQTDLLIVPSAKVTIAARKLLCVLLASIDAGDVSINGGAADLDTNFGWAQFLNAEH